MCINSIVKVHALIRHGARTPYTTPKCWEGYDITWNCNVTEVRTSLPSSRDTQTCGVLPPMWFPIGLETKYQCVIDHAVPSGVGFISPSVDRRFSKGEIEESDNVLYFTF